ncbi:MAG TPA: glycosyltransferase family 9 protein [Verrucomicrobiae bacterium]|jgi:ADP-heptose:LPS heptosyltransferase
MDTRENILLIRLKSIGDILFTLPAVHAVRQNFPGAKLHFLASKEFSPLLRGFAAVDEIIPLDRAIYRSGNLSSAVSGTLQLLGGLRRKDFSLVIDFHGHGETAWLSWVSGAPERWGDLQRPSRAWAYTSGFVRDSTIHPAEWNLLLLRQCGLRIGEVRNEFILPDDALKEAKQFFAANNLDAAKTTLFLQPFTSSPHKNWPLDNFLELARHFQSQGAQIIFGGGPSERAALELARAGGFAVAAGTPLLVTTGLMKLSSLVIGADTGLLHLAVTLGQRVVMLMLSIAPGQTHPFQHMDWAVTPPTGEISEISVAKVIAACERATG